MGSITNAISLSVANFVGSVVGFLNVFNIRFWSLLLAALLSFEVERHNTTKDEGKRKNEF